MSTYTIHKSPSLDAKIGIAVHPERGYFAIWFGSKGMSPRRDAPNVPRNPDRRELHELIRERFAASPKLAGVTVTAIASGKRDGDHQYMRDWRDGWAPAGHSRLVADLTPADITKHNANPFRTGAGNYAYTLYFSTPRPMSIEALAVELGLDATKHGRPVEVRWLDQRTYRPSVNVDLTSPDMPRVTGKSGKRYLINQEVSVFRKRGTRYELGIEGQRVTWFVQTDIEKGRRTAWGLRVEQAGEVKKRGFASMEGAIGWAERH